jgi:hypothetical protein
MFSASLEFAYRQAWADTFVYLIICDSLFCIRIDHRVLLMYASQAPVYLLQDFLVQNFPMLIQQVP